MKRSGFRRPVLPPRPAYIFPVSSSPSELGGSPRPVPKKPKPIRDAVHLKRVRLMPCIGCGAPGPGVVHHRHAEPGNLKGMGQTAGDDTVVPLCDFCHRRFHRVHVVGDRTRAETIALFEAVRAELWAARLEELHG